MLSQEVPYMAPVIARAALYWKDSNFLQKDSFCGWSYLKRTNFRVYLFSWVEKNCISRVLIFANGYFEKISRVMKKRDIFVLLKRKRSR